MTRKFARFLSSLILLMTGFWLAVQANAQMLTFEFNGTLNQVINDPSGEAAKWGSVGDPFWGTLSFDPTWQNANNGSGDYTYDPASDPAGQAITMFLNTPSAHHQIGINPVNLVTLSVGGSPGNYTFCCSGEYGNGYLMELVLTDPAGAGISGTSLPSNLNLNDWAGHYINVWGFQAGGDVQGDITSIQLVPEPHIGMVIGLGIVVWGLRRWPVVRAKAAGN
jgi:hypothetical protein